MENKQQGGSGWRMLLAVSVSHNNALFSCVILEIKRLPGFRFLVSDRSGFWLLVSSPNYCGAFVVLRSNSLAWSAPYDLRLLNTTYDL